jgi:hypothetical protein
MKTLAVFLISASCAFSAGWDSRVNYYANADVDSRLYAISENDGEYTVSKWDAESIGKPEPTIEQLTANDAAVDAWWAAYKYSIRQTPEWNALTNSIAAYPAVRDAATVDIQQVTDAKTKTALNDLKALCNQLQDEVQKLKKLVGKNMQVEP